MIVGPTLKQKLMDVVQPSDVSGARTLQWLLDDVPSIIQATAFELIRPPRPGRAYGWWCSSRNEMVLQEGAYARIIRAFEFTIGVESEARVSRKCELPGFREAYTPYADRLSGDGLVEPLQLAQSLLVFIAMTLASYVDTRKPRASNPEMSEHPSNVKYDPKRAYGHLYRDEHCLAVVEEILLGCSDHHHHGDLIALLKSFRARVDVEYKIADEWNSKPRPNWK